MSSLTKLVVRICIPTSLLAVISIWVVSQYFELMLHRFGWGFFDARHEILVASGPSMSAFRCDWVPVDDIPMFPLYEFTPSWTGVKIEGWPFGWKICCLHDTLIAVFALLSLLYLLWNVRTWGSPWRQGVRRVFAAFTVASGILWICAAARPGMIHAEPADGWRILATPTGWKLDYDSSSRGSFSDSACFQNVGHQRCVFHCVYIRSRSVFRQTLSIAVRHSFLTGLCLICSLLLRPQRRNAAQQHCAGTPPILKPDRTTVSKAASRSHTQTGNRSQQKHEESYRAVQPPSTVTILPVMKLPAGLASRMAAP